MSPPERQPLVKIWKFADAPRWVRGLYAGPDVPTWAMQVPEELVESIHVQLEHSPAILMEVRKYLPGHRVAVYIGTQTALDVILMAAQNKSKGSTKNQL